MGKKIQKQLDYNINQLCVSFDDDNNEDNNDDNNGNDANYDTDDDVHDHES